MPPEELHSLIKAEAECRGLAFRGDAYAGTLDVMGVRLRYSYRERSVEVIVLKKPFYVPASAIKREMIKFYSYLRARGAALRELKA